MAVKREFGISIDDTTEGKLRKLTEHFKGAVSGHPDLMTDDELLAVLLGWYFRNLPNVHHLELKSVLHAFLVRVWNSGTEPNHGHWEWQQIPSKYTRGKRPTRGSVLSPGGITSDTLDDVRFRVLSLSVLAQTFHNYTDRDGMDFEILQLSCAVLPDHVIVDACVAGELKSFNQDDQGEGKKSFPHEIECEIARRGNQTSWRRPEFNVPDWPATEGFA